MGKANKELDPFAIEAGVPKIEGGLRPKPRLADRISARVIGVAMAVLLGIVAIFFASLNGIDAKNKKHDDSGSNGKTTVIKPTDQVVPKDLTDSMAAAAAASGASAPTVSQPSLVVPPSAAPTQFGAAAASTGVGGGLGVDPRLDGSGVPSLTGGANGARGMGAGSSLDVAQGGRGGHDGLGQPGTGGPNGLDQGSATINPSASVVATPTAEQQAAQIARADRLKRMAQARTSGLSAKAFALDDKAGSAAAPMTTAMNSLLAAAKTSGASTTPATQPQKTDSEQDEKASFLKTSGKESSDYLAHARTVAASPNELQLGSWIPMRLETMINSDLPGHVKARVTEDVYDTSTGCRLLIPAMSTVVGQYDSKVAVGQTRNLVVWNYMQFEDGSHLDLDSMEGYDSGGAAGLAADVDNHYLRLFSLAFGMSLVTAGVAESVPSSTSTSTTQTPQQALSTALAQQYGQLGASILGKMMQVQPTLRNYAGERFMIMLPSTIIMDKVWRNRCGGR
jgi:type IV secretory pathway VirB10-like protein